MVSPQCSSCVESHSPDMIGNPAIAAGPGATALGSKSASKPNILSVASMPRVAPKSLSAATASKNAWFTVVFSEEMNLGPESAPSKSVRDREGVLGLIGIERRNQLFVRVSDVERDEIRQVLHAGRYVQEFRDILIDLNLYRIRWVSE